MNRKALIGWIAAVLVLGGLGAVPATVAHASGSTVVISPPSLVFSLASYRSTSLPQTVTVRNTGASTVTFQRARIGGANPSEFVKESDGCSNFTVNVGGSCQVQVSFAPRAYPLGARTATLMFFDDATTGGQNVSLSGTSVFDPPLRQDYINSVCCSSFNTKVQSISRGPGSTANMWITEVGQSMLGVIPVSGGSVMNIAAGAGSKPYGLAIAPSDTTDVFFTDQNGNGRLAKMDITTHTVTTLAPFPAAASNPGNLTVGPDGNLWGVEMGAANRIFRFTLPGGPLDEISTGLPANSGLNSITQGPSGDTNLYFTMSTAAKLGKISTVASPAITILPTALTNTWVPSGIVTGPDGHLWVTLAGVSHVISVATDGTSPTLHPLPTSNAHPVGIAADSAGNLYVTGAGKLSKVHFASNVFSYIADIPMTSNGTQGLYGVGWGAVATDAANDAWFSQWITYSPTNINGYLYEYVITGAPSPGLTPGTPVQYGNQAVNSYSGDYSDSLYNSGTNDLHVTATTFGGSGAAFFHFTSNACLGHALPPGQSCQVSVNFGPGAVQAYAATLTFTMTNAFGGAIPSIVQNLAGTGTAQAPMSQFPIHASAFGPYCAGYCSSSNLIANGPSSIVFAEPNINRVGMFTTAGALSQWVVPTSSAGPISIAWDGTTPGNLWFTESNAGQIGKLNLSTHVITEFPVPTGDATPISIVFDPANNLAYFTASGREGAFIDSINSSGVITEYLQPNGYYPGRVIVGGDGNIWAETSGQLLKMTPTGTFLTSPPTTGPLGTGLANGPVVNGQPTIWYAAGSQVSYMTVDNGISANGTFVEPISIGSIQGLAQGTGNTMYLTIGGGGYGMGDANKVAKVVVAGTTIGGFVDQSISHEDSSPTGITLGPDRNVWWLEQNPGALGREAPF